MSIGSRTPTTTDPKAPQDGVRVAALLAADAHVQVRALPATLFAPPPRASRPTTTVPQQPPPTPWGLTTLSLYETRGGSCPDPGQKRSITETTTWLSAATTHPGPTQAWPHPVTTAIPRNRTVDPGLQTATLQTRGTSSPALSVVHEVEAVIAERVDHLVVGEPAAGILVFTFEGELNS